MEKPKILYHGSSEIELGELRPHQRSFRDEHEGPLIFATPNKALATIFMAKEENSVRASGFMNDILYAVICRNREDFIAEDNGGAVYELSSEHFSYDPHKGLREMEWTSKIPVKPISLVVYDSVLQAMLESGVQVYFVAPPIIADISNSKDFGMEILRNIESENQRRQINVRKF